MILSLLLGLVPIPSAEEGLSKLGTVAQQLLDLSVTAGGRLLGALLIFVVGRILISFINKLVAKLMLKRQVDASIQSFGEYCPDDFIGYCRNR